MKTTSATELQFLVQWWSQKYSPTLITQYLWEVFQEHPVTGSLIRVWRHQLLPWKCFIQVLTGDWGLPDQLALAGLQNRNQPTRALLKVPVRFVLQIDVDYLMAKRAKETRLRQAQFYSSPPHTMVKCSHLNSSVPERLNPQAPALPYILWSCLQD